MNTIWLHPHPVDICLPLDRAALCLDCEVCFSMEKSSCPACGSRTWAPLARFLTRDRESILLAAALRS